MPLFVRELAVENYRSLKDLRAPVERLSVFVGPNGVGKTNLYRALQLLQGAASGRFAMDVALEGGLDSVFWAGPRRREPARIRLEVGLGAAPANAPGPSDYRYTIEVGFRTPTSAAFAAEALIKSEILVFRHRGRDVRLLDRKGAAVTARDEDGRGVEIDADLMASETALSQLTDPSRFPDLHLVRQALLDWRFYHDLRTDPDSPMRRPSPAVASPNLASDGSNLAAVFATLAHIREDTDLLDLAVGEAFPGARLIVPPPERDARFGLAYETFPDRVFEAHELSDGTLRFLGLAGALLAYRLPSFVALNEPEASLHPDLIPPLARLIVDAAERSQVWVVTHSEPLAEAIAEFGGVSPRSVIKREGATEIVGLRFGAYADDED